GRAVVPQVRAGVTARVREVVADRLPGEPAVVGPLDDLPEPARVLRSVDPVRVRRRPLEVVDLPPAEVRPADRPLLPLLVRSQHERALARSGQHPYLCHTFAFLLLPHSLVGRAPYCFEPSSKRYAGVDPVFKFGLPLFGYD